ncbi:MAG: hypothetical protein ACK5NF_07575 [Bacilli bacterium]
MEVDEVPYRSMIDLKENGDILLIDGLTLQVVSYNVQTKKYEFVEKIDFNLVKFSKDTTNFAYANGIYEDEGYVYIDTTIDDESDNEISEERQILKMDSTTYEVLDVYKFSTKYHDDDKFLMKSFENKGTVYYFYEYFDKKGMYLGTYNIERGKYEEKKLEYLDKCYTGDNENSGVYIDVQEKGQVHALCFDLKSSEGNLIKMNLSNDKHNSVMKFDISKSKAILISFLGDFEVID